MSGKNDESPEPDIPGMKSSSIELIPTGDVIIRSHVTVEVAKKRDVELDYLGRVATTSTKISPDKEDLTAVAELPKSSGGSEAQKGLEKREDEDQQPELCENREIDTATLDTAEGEFQDGKVSDCSATLTQVEVTPCPIITTSTLAASTSQDQVHNHTNDTENNSTTRSSSPTFEAISNPSSPTSCPEDPVQIGKEISAVSKQTEPLSRSTSATTTSSITTSTTVSSASSESNLAAPATTSHVEIAGEKVKTSQGTNKISSEPTFPVVSVSNKEVLQTAQIPGKNLDKSDLRLKISTGTDANKQESNMNISQHQEPLPSQAVSEPSRSSSPCCQCCCIGDCCCNCEQSDSESDEEEDSCVPCLRDLFSVLPFVKVRRKTKSNIAQSQPPTPIPPVEKQENVTEEAHKDDEIVDKQEVASIDRENRLVDSIPENRISPSSPPPQQLKVEVVDIIEVEAEVVPEVTRVENVPKHKETQVRHVPKKSEQVSETEKQLQLQVTATPDTLQLQPVATAKEGKKENETFSFKGIMNLFSVYKQMLLTPTQDGEDGRETPTENVVVDRTPSPAEPRQEKPGIVTQISDPDVFERQDDSDISSVTSTGTNKRRGLKQKFKNWFNLKKAARKMRQRYKSTSLEFSERS